MLDKKTFDTHSLVLKVKDDAYNPMVLRLDDWDRYLDLLCGTREYQKAAIKFALIYLFGGKYQSIQDLVKENYKVNFELQKRYVSLDDYLAALQLTNTLSGIIDLATGTGKSYVMFGIAQVALGLGMVDKVLVLCPSLTIEKGLTLKFNELNSNAALAKAIPLNSKIGNPNIKDASVTIKNGDICIENIHAVYSRAQSSILDSLGFGKGSQCLVLNDEAHHIFNKIEGTTDEAKSLKKWKEFLIDPTYKFNFVLGFTGTAYVDNEYCNDVIFRYSLKAAIQDRIVKMVYYAAKDETHAEGSIRYQKIYQNHRNNKDEYRDIKALTLLVTRDIRLAKQLASTFADFLAAQENIPVEDASKKVLIVTSHSDHETNVRLHLPAVDSKESPFEYIVSVAMLTEGWDVKNVFQIVPMEERAFNSKLLIAQVLGRGLRVPFQYPHSRVIVFNHDSWSGKIKSLVDEILEIETRIVSSTLGDNGRGQYHFDLYNINYERDESLKPTKETQTFDYTKELIRLQSQTAEFETSINYENISGQTLQRTYQIKRDTESVAKVANKIFEEFRTRKFEGIALKLADAEYTANTIPREAITRIIKNSMMDANIDGDELTLPNRQAIYSAFNTLLRKKPKSLTFTKKVNPYFKISSRERRAETLSIGNLRRDTSVFYSSAYKDELIDHDTLSIFDELKDDREFRGAFIPKNEFCLKTPVDIIFSSSVPEEKFIENLCKLKNSEKITAWLKSRNQNFYAIEYSLTRNDSSHTKKQQQFNPDFFLFFKDGECEKIVVVEIKENGDASDENKAKFKYAKQHFSDLNEALSVAKINQEYIFHFLSPSNYTEFFDFLQNGKLLNGEFRSELDNLLQD
jgi:type III restriction enzyme